ncbi:hypothetical protein AB1Y20_004725 [Prymnesium parvum]|uniref:inosine/xanthosine triphosphatase n=1 Tax=Prymnesium parvum TaxID=97485 RepID=A0AB34IYY4_PRYPA
MAALSVAVGSTNPVKADAARAAFAAAFSGRPLAVEQYDVPSGVSAQPWGDAATREGAIHRALAAAACHAAAHGVAPHFAVGMEGGVEDDEVAARHRALSRHAQLPRRATQCFAWMVVVRTDGERQEVGMARTATVTLPPRIVALMKGDPPMELGDADDKVFNEVNSKQKGGTVVKLTAGLIDRTDYYAHALKLALAPFMHDETGLYADVKEVAVTPKCPFHGLVLLGRNCKILLPCSILLVLAFSASLRWHKRV